MSLSQNDISVSQRNCTTPKISQNIKYFFATSLKTLIFRDQISAPCGCICWPVPPCFQFPHLLLQPHQHLPPCAHLQHLLLHPHHHHLHLQHLLLHVLHHPANTCFDLPATIINICISTCALRSAHTINMEPWNTRNICSLVATCDYRADTLITSSRNAKASQRSQFVFR